MKNTRIWISLLLTVFVNILCLPLWTEYDYGSFIRTLFNKEARLDLVYSGKLTGTEPFLLQSVSQPVTATYWYGYESRNPRRANLNLRARRKWQKLSLQVEPLQDGKITVLLRGPDARNDYGELFAALTDWRNLKINGKMIFAERRTFSYVGNDLKYIPEKKHELPWFNHDLMFAEPGNFPYVGKHAQSIPVKKHKRVEIEVEFRRHHFSIHDFTCLKSGKVWYLITGNLLFFFLIYLLLSYLAKRRESIRLGDMMLLSIFFLLLFIPMLAISDAVRSVRGNRMLAVKPVLKDIFREKSDYGRRFENWFNDHFCGCIALTRLHDIIRNKLSYVIRTRGVLYFKDNDWFFLKPYGANMDYQLTSIRCIIQNLVQLNLFCEQNKIKLYLLEVPRKEIIYNDIIKGECEFYGKKFIMQAQEGIRNGARKHRIPYVYPYEALQDATKKDLVFFKRLWHWTDWGAFVGYRELMGEIRKDFPDIPVASLDDYCQSQNRLIRDDWSRNYHQGYLYRFCNLEKAPHNAFITYYDHKNADKMSVRVGKFTKDFAYPEGKHKVMLIGSSQNENFLQFLPYSAAYTKYIRLNTGWIRGRDEYKIMKLYKKDILAFKPDILILSIHTDTLFRLRDLCSAK